MNFLPVAYYEMLSILTPRDRGKVITQSVVLPYPRNVKVLNIFIISHLVCQEVTE